MNIDELTVEVRDASYERVGQILPRDLVGFKAVLRFNNVGSWEIILPQGHEAGEILRLPGSGIIVTGNDEVILSGPTVSATNTKTSDNPSGEWLITGLDDSVVLGERLAYPSPDVLDVTQQTVAYDSRPGLASTAMYGYVEANIGSLAPTGRRIDNLALESDTGLGSFVYPAARFDVLGELLAGIASVDGLGFDIRQNDGTLVFRVFEPIDRSGEIRMDVANNTLSKTEYAYGSHSLSRAIVAGQGEGLNRQFLEITSTDSLAAESLWGRRIEKFVDQRNTQDENELTQAGVEKLADGGATLTSVDVVPSNDLTMSYGRDWGLGDRVTVVVDGQEVSSTVTTVSMSIDSDGVRVGATVGEPTGVDYESKMAKRTTSTAQRVNALERKEVPAIVWNDTDGTYEFVLKGGNVTLQIGQEQVAYVKNNTGATLMNGTVVYPNGSNGVNKLVAKAQANSESTSTQTFGVLTEDILNGEHGFVTTFGMVRDIDTSALTEGQPVWLSPTVAGGMTSTKPVAPNHMVLVGFCVRQHAVNGALFVKVQNGLELNELHDVLISSKTNGQVLVATANGWENKTLTLDNLSDVTVTTPSAGQAFVYNGSQWVNGAATSQSDIPTGSIVATVATTAPSGWLMCDGSAVSRTTYANLFGVIGTTYGAGNGSTTFNLPDLKGRVPVGRDSGQSEFDTLGETGGANTHTLTTTEMPSHNHGPGALTYFHILGNSVSRQTMNTSGSYWVPASQTLNDVNITSVTSSTGGGNAHNNLQPYQVVNYVIKFTSAFVSTDSELATRLGVVEAKLPSTGLAVANGGTGATTVEGAQDSLRVGLVQIIPPTVLLTPPGGTATANSLGTISFTSVTSLSLNNVFSSAYRNYQIIISNVLGTVSGSGLYFRLRNAGTDRTDSTYSGRGLFMTSSTTGLWTDGGTAVRFVNLDTVAWGSANVIVCNPDIAAYRTTYTNNAAGLAADSNAMVVSAGQYGTANSNDGFTIYPGSGTMSGTVQVFGYNS